uniref:Protein hunchback n=1 Tax=Photinus pyralis TaxID=7054 RepID=A0A1Y1L9J3_PHOPY
MALVPLTVKEDDIKPLITTEYTSEDVKIEPLKTEEVDLMEVEIRVELVCQGCWYRTFDKKEFMAHIPLCDRKRFVCNVCGFRTAYRYLLTRHMAQHLGERNFKCDQCDYTGFTAAIVRRHAAKHSKDEFFCDNCPYATKLKGSLRIHMLKHIGGKTRKCTVCNYSTNIKRNMQMHMLQHTRPKVHCNQCDYKGYSDSLKLHVLRVHDRIKPFACDKCPFRAFERKSLQLHQSTHSNNYLYCLKCKYKSTNKRNLKRHLQLHTRNFKCPSCNFSTASGVTFRYHKLRHLAQSFKCDQCDFSTYLQSALVAHKRKHATKKVPHMAKQKPQRFNCTLCGYTTPLKYHLRVHSLLHLKKVLKCEVCDYKTYYPKLLESHSKTSGHAFTNLGKSKCERSNVPTPRRRARRANVDLNCDLCDYVATSRDERLSHNESHLDDAKLYTCNICGYKVESKPPLKQHMLVHQLERRYACDRCEYAGKTEKYLRMHMLVHTCQNLKCIECDFVTSQPKYLNRHMQKHYNSEVSMGEYCKICNESNGRFWKGSR